MTDAEIDQGYPCSENVNKHDIAKPDTDDRKGENTNDNQETEKKSHKGKEEDSMKIEKKNDRKNDTEDLTMEKIIDHRENNRRRCWYAKRGKNISRVQW